MEVVATGAKGTDQAMIMCEASVRMVITDVNMPGKTGLQMIARWDLIPDAAFIIVSGYQVWDMSDSSQFARGRLPKPVNKVEMGNILEKIQHQITANQANSHRFDSRWYLWGRILSVHHRQEPL